MINIKPGQTYRHFEGGLYMIVTVAWHIVTGEALVIYHRVDINDGRLWARPLSSFMSLVDRAKYPDADQIYRFEQVGDGDD